MSAPITLVVGASGFIGSSAVRALVEGSHRVRGLVRSAAAPSQDGVQLAIGSLEDLSSLTRACAGAATVIHAASYVGSDPERCAQVNIEGTRRLLEAAHRAGVSRVVYVSTTGVYGTGPHRGIAVDGVPRAPESPASASRLAAEQLVLEAGGVVVRPNIVHGPGDRWFAPNLIKLTVALDGLVEGGKARVSTISAADLGHLLARLSIKPPTAGTVLHAAYPEPVTVRKLLEQLGPTPLELPLDRPIPFDEAVARAKPLGLTRHQIAMVALDHWYESRAIWSGA